MDVAELVAALRPRLAGALIATDFDGTLAPLVPDPEASRPVRGAVTALIALAGRGAQVAVITGREAETALRLGGLDAVPGIVVAGLYGAQTWSAGTLHSPAPPPAVDDLRSRLPGVVAAGDPDVWIEDKGLSLVVHARRAADPGAALDALRGPVAELAAELGFEVHPGSGVLELRLRGGEDKGGVLARLAAGRPTVLFLGDDLGDRPAFAQVRRLRDEGVPAYSVGVASSGLTGLAEEVDVVVPDPDAATGLLAALIA